MLIDAYKLIEAMTGACSIYDAHGIDTTVARSLITIAEKAPTVGGWISVKDRLPEEKPSIFNRFHGTAKWSSAMWRYNSDPVIVAVKFPDGTGRVTIGETHDGVFRSAVSGCLPHEVTHWMPLPEMPEVGK